MKKKALVVSAAAIFAAAAFGVVYLNRHKPAPRPAEPPRKVFQDAEIALPASIQASSVVPVPAPVDGAIEVLAAGAGQEVYEGQLLGRIRNVQIENARQHAESDYERAQERARALESALIAARLEASRARADASRIRGEYERLEKIYQRQQMLVREGATPRLNYERAKAEFEAAQLEFSGMDEIAKQAEERAAAIQKNIETARRALQESEREMEQAKENAAGAEIHSPVNGFIVAVAKREGEEVTRDLKDLFHIAVNLTLLEAIVEPAPPALERVRPGQEAMITFAELPDALPGRVKEIRNGSQVVVEFANPSPAVRPGMTGQVRIRLI